MSVELGSDGLGEFSPEDHDFEPVEVTEVFSQLLFPNGFSPSGLEEELRGLEEFWLESLDVAVIGESLEDVSGGLDSLDGNDLSEDWAVWAVDDDFFGVDEVSDDCELLGVGSVVDIDDSSDLNEDFGIHFWVYNFYFFRKLFLGFLFWIDCRVVFWPAYEALYFELLEEAPLDFWLVLEEEFLL